MFTVVVLRGLGFTVIMLGGLGFTDVVLGGLEFTDVVLGGVGFIVIVLEGLRFTYWALEGFGVTVGKGGFPGQGFTGNKTLPTLTGCHVLPSTPPFLLLLPPPQIVILPLRLRGSGEHFRLYTGTVPELPILAPRVPLLLPPWCQEILV